MLNSLFEYLLDFLLLHILGKYLISIFNLLSSLFAVNILIIFFLLSEVFCLNDKISSSLDVKVFSDNAICVNYFLVI